MFKLIIGDREKNSLILVNVYLKDSSFQDGNLFVDIKGGDGYIANLIRINSDGTISLVADENLKHIGFQTDENGFVKIK